MLKSLALVSMEDGSLKEINIDGQEIVLAKINGQYYAAQNRCPHLGGQLHLGKLQGNIITCPRHGSQFNIKDGSVVRWLKGSGLVSALGKAIKPPRSIKIYPVKIDANRITIDI
jgi:3-phenylpropionate/trans-cinnamate dioxygenase ferredoxin component